MINYPEIQSRINSGLITSRKHPFLPLEILNYTQKVQFEKLWDSYTKMCRGLILDENHNIIARPFPKFFNLNETPETFIQNLPNEIPKIAEKYDGCFLHNTALNLWEGGTIYIGDVVHNKLKPTLIGMENNKIIPCNVIDWYNNGTKNNWLAITLDCNVSTKSGMGNFSNILRVTDNHYIHINSIFQPAINAKIGDIVTSFELQPNKYIIHTVNSGLLGDGSLCIQGYSGKYMEAHKIGHSMYVEYIRDWLGNQYSPFDIRISGFGTEMKRTTSKFYKLLYDVRNTWYKNGMKCIPDDLSWMDDFSIAKWYMDDGTLSHNINQQDRAVFSTNGFKKEDVYRLANRLEEMYKVKCTVYYDRGHVLRVNAGRDASINKFWMAIAPHIVTVMKYKLPEEYRKIPYINRVSGQDSLEPIEAHIIDIKRIDNTKRNFPSGRTGFDIKTTTGNYFAKGILVHNSLGILFPENDKPAIATRGTFESDQARWATNWIRKKEYSLEDFKSNYTYLFEIIAPISKNVVNYNTEDLILLAVISNKDGTEIDHEKEAISLGFSYAKTYSFDEINTAIKWLEQFSGIEKEGLVCKYSNGLRVKIKSDDYKRLHKIMSSFTEKDIWEHLSKGKSIEDFINILPDEFYQWIRDTEKNITENYNKILNEAITISNIVSKLPLPSRKDQANYILFHTKDKPKGFSGVIFSLLDGNTEKAQQQTWNIIKP